MKRHQFHCWNMLNNKYDTASRQRVNIGKCIPCVKQEKASVFQLCRGVMECQMITRVAANNEGTVSCVPIGGGMWRADAVWLAAVPILQKLESCAPCQGGWRPVGRAEEAEPTSLVDKCVTDVTGNPSDVWRLDLEAGEAEEQSHSRKPEASRGWTERELDVAVATVTNMFHAPVLCQSHGSQRQQTHI